MEQSRAIMSALEREEMERQLDNTKTELFAEQRRAREKIEFLEEKLEESREELDRSTETGSSLRNRCACLEEKQIQKTKQIEVLEVQQNKLQHELGECKIRVGILDRMLDQKELQLLDWQGNCETLQAGRDELKRELEHQQAQHVNELQGPQEQAHTAMVPKAVEEERRKCEAEKQEAAQVYCRTLEEQLERLRREMEREKSTSLAVRHLMEELRTQSQKTTQRLEDDVQLAVKERDRLQAVLEERERSHQLFRGEMEQQLRGWAKQLTAECQQLHVLVEQSGAKRRAGEPLWCCLHIRVYIHLIWNEVNILMICLFVLCSFTVTEALAHLGTLREEFTRIINHLQQELESQKQSYEQLRKDKDRELRFQKQQLWVERDRALNSVKERLIQEHIEELSSLKWGHVSGGGAEGGPAASLRRQLRAKDLQLRQVQRSMAQWREQTAARLACRFEEELTAELERCPSLRARQGLYGTGNTSVCPHKSVIALPLTVTGCADYRCNINYTFHHISLPRRLTLGVAASRRAVRSPVKDV
ncbi:uncharacterized protein FYW49_003260 [Xenentodon cancila]